MLQTAQAIHDPVRMRRAGAELLSLALIDARNHTLRWLSAFEPHLAAPNNQQVRRETSLLFSRYSVKEPE